MVCLAPTFEIRRPRPHHSDGLGCLLEQGEGEVDVLVSVHEGGTEAEGRVAAPAAVEARGDRLRFQIGLSVLRALSLDLSVLHALSPSTLSLTCTLLSTLSSSHAL